MCRDGERVTLSYLVSQKLAGGKARLSVFRDGVDVEIDVELSEPIKLVPRHIGGRRPSYLVVAGKPCLASACANARRSCNGIWLVLLYNTQIADNG